LKPNTKLVRDGLTKRTVTVKGSGGLKHRVVTYFSASDVVMYKARLHLPKGAGGASTSNRNGELFQRPVDDEELTQAVRMDGIDLVKLARLTYPDASTKKSIAVNKKLRMKKVEAVAVKSDRWIALSERTLEPAARARAIVSLYSVDFADYYPYEATSVTYETFMGAKRSPPLTPTILAKPVTQCGHLEHHEHAFCMPRKDNSSQHLHCCTHMTPI